MNRTLRGRPLLNLVVREFDLDATLGGVVSAVKICNFKVPNQNWLRSFIQRQGSSNLRTIAD